MQIDPRPFQATVDRDRANLASAEADLCRYGPLLKQGVVSQQQVETQKSQVAQLRATVAAPIAGVLGLRLVDVGNVVSPSNPGGLVVLTQVQPSGGLSTPFIKRPVTTFMLPARAAAHQTQDQPGGDARAHPGAHLRHAAARA